MKTRKELSHLKSKPKVMCWDMRRATKHNHEAVIISWIRDHQNRPDDLNAEGKRETSLFVWALRKNNIPVLTALLSCPGINVNKQIDAKPPLFWLIEQEHKEQFSLVLHYPQTDLLATDGCDSLISETIRNRLLGLFKESLEQLDKQVNITDSSNRTALLRAAMLGYQGFIDVLLNNPHVDLNAQDKEGRTAAMLLVDRWVKLLPLAQTLISKPELNPELQDDQGNNLLMHTLSRKEFEALSLLILTQHPEYAYTSNKNNETPLIRAANSGQTKFVAALLEHMDSTQQVIAA